MAWQSRTKARAWSFHCDWGIGLEWGFSLVCPWPYLSCTSINVKGCKHSNFLTILPWSWKENCHHNVNVMPYYLINKGNIKLPLLIVHISLWSTVHCYQFVFFSDFNRSDINFIYNFLLRQNCVYLIAEILNIDLIDLINTEAHFTINT